MLLVIFVLITGVWGYLVFEDVRDIDKNFANSTKLFVFDDDGELVYGFRSDGYGLVEKDLLTQEELSSIQLSFDNGDYNDMLGDNYRMLIFKRGIFKDNVVADGFEKEMQEQGPSLIYREIRNGNITVYPETPFFKAFRFVPDSVAEDMRMFE